MNAEKSEFGILVTVDGKTFDWYGAEIKRLIRDNGKITRYDFAGKAIAKDLSKEEKETLAQMVTACYTKKDIAISKPKVDNSFDLEYEMYNTKGRYYG